MLSYRTILSKCVDFAGHESYVPERDISGQCEGHSVHKLGSVRDQGKERDPQELLVDP